MAEQLKKAEDKTEKLKTAQKEVEQSKQWTKNAVKDLEEQARFIENEVALLNEAKTTSKTELDAEVKRVEDEVKNHEATTDVMSKSQQVLVTQCKLSEDDLSSNCAEANAALRRAVGGLKELDEFLASYVVELTKVANEQKVEIEATLTTQKGSLFQARADLNKRKDELAQLASDVVKAKENLILASKADSALQTNCGPKVSSKEDMITARKEQIEQLKNAVLVLDGQVFGPRTAQFCVPLSGRLKINMNSNLRSLLGALQQRADLAVLKPLITPETAKAKDIFYGLLPLFWALSGTFRQNQVLRALLDAYPAAAEEKHPQGWTPLHYAEKLDAEALKLLLARCPKTASREVDNEGALPLHWVAEHDAPKEVVELLLEAYPEGLSKRDGRGRVPAQLAMEASLDRDGGLVHMLLGTSTRTGKVNGNQPK
eukprot:symbB.v1.2.002856.t1/scaffold130.1/size334612/7